MTLETGVAKKLIYKKETTWGTLAGATGAQRLRRVSSDLDLKKNTYQSNEIRSDFQIGDFRHGTRKAEGSISGELSSKTYADFFAALLRRNFAAVTAVSGLSITITGTGPSYTISRATGSWLTSGVKLGDVIRLTAGTFNANNLNKNLYIVGETALDLTVYVLNGETLTLEGPIASATVSLPGKKTFVPQTGHTDESFTIEHFYSSIAQSEVFTGCKVASADVQLPTTGMATVSFAVMGKDIVTGTSAYFTTPTDETTTGVLAAVSGFIVVNNVPVAIITGSSISISGGYSAGEVVGSNSLAAVFPGRVMVTGNMSAYFENATFRDMFKDETECAMYMYLTDGTADAADFVSFVFHRVKVGGSSKSDGEQGIVQTIPYQVLLAAGSSSTNTEKTTMSIQDSQA